MQVISQLALKGKQEDEDPGIWMERKYATTLLVNLYMVLYRRNISELILNRVAYRYVTTQAAAI